jgi:uncharacterized surface protein with fasciclin (FAS1) repeats
MKQRILAAAVLVALGSTHAAAQQQPGSQQDADRPQTQTQTQTQQEQERQTQRDQQEGVLDTAQRDTQRDASDRDDSPFGAADERDSPFGAADEREEGVAAADRDRQAGGSASLDGIAQEHDDLSTFIEAVRAAGMEDSLTGSTQYTVFAPTNDAWEEMSGMSKDELMQPQNREQLIALLRAHIVADDVDEQMARSLPQAQTIDGGAVDLSAEDDSIRVGDARVVQDGIHEGNLRIYAIDSVLSPTALARADDLGQQGQSDFGSDRDLEDNRDSPFGGQDQPGAQQPGQPGALPVPPQPGQPGAQQQPGQPGAQPGAQQPGAQQPGQPGAMPGQDRPGALPGEPGSQLPGQQPGAQDTDRAEQDRPQ